MNVRWRALWGAWALAAGLVACSAETPAPPTQVESPDVELLSFEASSYEVAPGDPVTLSWEARDASAVQLFAGSVPVQLGDAPPEEGSVEVVPVRTTIYRLEVRGANGSTDERELTVRLAPLPDPSIISFEADRAEFGLGTPVNLSWRIEGATTISIVDRAGRQIDTGGANLREGSVEVHPSQSTAYTLTAKGSGKEVRAQVELVLVPAPTATITVGQPEIPLGGEVSLSWQTTGASEVRIREADGELVLSEERSGSIQVSPERTTVYVVEARGVGGSALAEARISVAPVVEHFAPAEDEEVRPGSLVELEWAIKGATSAVISNRGGWIYEIPAGSIAAGRVSAPVGPGGVFTLLPTGSGIDGAERSIILILTSAPKITSLRVDPAEGITAGRGVVGRVTLSWEVEGADGPLLLQKIPGGPVNLVAYPNRFGSIELNLDGPTDLQLTALNAAGSDEEIVAVPITPPAAIRSFTASPAKVGAGEMSELSWEVDDAVALRLEKDDVVIATPADVGFGVHQDLVAAPANYRLIATNALGHESISAPLSVAVGAPEILSFDSSLAFANPGDPIDLRWRSLGGATLEITQQGSKVCSSNDVAEIGRGGCALEAPGTTGPVEYRLVVENGAGRDERTLTVGITSGPTIRSFTADRGEVVEGGTVNLSWRVSEGLGDEIPSLSLRDDRGQRYSLDGQDPLAGTVTVEASPAGRRTYTLDATTDDPSQAVTATVAVDVAGLPRIASLWAEPEYAILENEAVTIRWATESGASLEVFSLSAAGAPSAAATCSSTDPEEVAEGSCVVRPTKADPNVRLVLRHRLGKVVSRDLRVGVKPATVLSFTADPVVLLKGSTATLSWETRDGDVQEIGPRFEETGEPFFDIRNHPSRQVVTIDRSNTYGASLFPGGFRFPYFGREIDRACVAGTGFLNFFEADGACRIWDPIDLPVTGDFASRPDVLVYATPDMMPSPADWSLLTALIEDPRTGGRAMIFQWSGWQIMGGTGTHMNFQVLLHEDGTIDYRYGPMLCQGSACVGEGGHAAVNGAGTTIGYQDPFGSGLFYYLFPPRTMVPGGLSNRSFKLFPAFLEFAGPVAARGSKVVRPLESRDFHLLTKNEHSSDRKTVRIDVYERARITSFQATPAEPFPGDPFRLEWTTTDATALSVLDGEGAVIFQTSDPTELSQGRLAFPEGLPPGDHRYGLKVEGYFEDVVEAQVDLQVYPPYSLDGFTADKELLELEESAILSWEASSLTSVQLTAIPGGPLTLPGDLDLDNGSVQVSPAITTTYRLEAESYGRVQVREVMVQVRSAGFLGEPELSNPVIFPGEATTVSWSGFGNGVFSIEQSPATTAATDLYVLEPALGPMVEVSDASSKYRDISGSGTPVAFATDFANQNTFDLEFEPGFSFPWMGEERTSLRIVRNGWLSFSATGNNVPSRALPTGAAGHDLAVFTSTMRANVGETHYLQDNTNGTLTIQWKGYLPSATAANGTSLNFQVVLFRDGTVEYRYGEMSGPNPVYFAGNQAYVGWQNPQGKWGYSLVARAALPGGFLDRSWRVDPITSNGAVITVKPSVPTTYRICLTAPGWQECKSVTVGVIAPGSIELAEFMITPKEAAPGVPSPQWIELRNYNDFDIDLRGMQVWFLSAANVEERLTLTSSESITLPGHGYKVISTGPIPGVDAHVYCSDPACSATPQYLMRSGGNRQQMKLYGRGASPAMISSYNSPNGYAFRDGKSRGKSNVHPPTFLSNSQSIGFVEPTWCDGATVYDEAGNMGTPGELNSNCGDGGDFYDIDWFSSMPFVDLSSGDFPSLDIYPQGPLHADQVAEIPGGLPFSIRYFDRTLLQGHPLFVSSNGFAQLGALTSAYPNKKTMPGTAAPNGGLLAPYWSNLETKPGSEFHYFVGKTGGRQVVGLQWTDVGIEDTPGSATFQVQIWENGDIVYAFGELIGESWYHGGWSATGIEAIGGAAGGGVAGYTYTNGQQKLRNHQSILFKRKAD